MDGTVTGQGAGTAAAISIKVSSQEIKEIDSIQARLLTITWYAGGREIDSIETDSIQALLTERW